MNENLDRDRNDRRRRRNTPSPGAQPSAGRSHPVSSVLGSSVSSVLGSSVLGSSVPSLMAINPTAMGDMSNEPGRGRGEMSVEQPPTHNRSWSPQKALSNMTAAAIAVRPPISQAALNLAAAAAAANAQGQANAFGLARGFLPAGIGARFPPGHPAFPGQFSPWLRGGPPPPPPPPPPQGAAGANSRYAVPGQLRAPPPPPPPPNDPSGFAMTAASVGARFPAGRADFAFSVAPHPSGPPPPPPPLPQAGNLINIPLAGQGDPNFAFAQQLPPPPPPPPPPPNEMGRGGDYDDDHENGHFPPPPPPPPNDSRKMRQSSPKVSDSLLLSLRCWLFS